LYPVEFSMRWADVSSFLRIWAAAERTLLVVFDSDIAFYDDWGV
jgi:hypothetical protein